MLRGHAREAFRGEHRRFAQNQTDRFQQLSCGQMQTERPEVNYSLTLRAASHEDAIAWTTALQDAIAETRDYDPWAAKGKSKGSTIDKE